MSGFSTKEIKNQLQQMDPYDFEKLVAEIWQIKGYHTTVRSKSGDRGIDVEATKMGQGSEKVLIQAKRYSGDRKVGSQQVRRYATLYQQVPDADSVVIAATSTFTSEAERIGSEQGVRTEDVKDISNIVKGNVSRLDNFEAVKEEIDRDELIRKAKKQKRQEKRKKRRRNRIAREKKPKYKKLLQEALKERDSVKVTLSKPKNRSLYALVEYSDSRLSRHGTSSVVKFPSKLRKINFSNIEYVDSFKIGSFEIVIQTTRDHSKGVHPELTIVTEVLNKSRAGFSYIELPE